MLDFLLILDAGHGGVNPETGEYTTAPAKMWEHDVGEFHEGSKFYEGVFNRELAARVLEKAKRLHIPTVTTHDTFRDTPLSERVSKANFYHRVQPNSLFVSIHANASATHTARGTEVYTSPGETRADVYAMHYWSSLRDLFGKRSKIRFREGHPDKEANFYVVTRTTMPALLVETLFFDNLDDALLLMQDDVQNIFAEAIIQASILTAAQIHPL